MVTIFNEFEAQRILVVGGAGFVGSNLVKTLLHGAPREIVVVDNLLSSEKTNVPDVSEATFIEGSITDDNILSDLKDDFDYIFHLATYHGNQSSIHDPLADHENNLLTSLKLFNRIKDFKKLKKVVYSGAGCAVAEKTFDEARPTSEDKPISLEMDSPYSISKIVGEFYAVYFHKQHGLPTVRARFQNVYGPGEILGAGEWWGTPATVWRNVIPTFIYRAIQNMPLIVENEGISTRDFIYVDDIVRGLMLCATEGKAGDVYNLASGVETSILNLAEMISSLMENPAKIQLGLKRDWDNSGRRFGSTVKTRDELSFEASVDLQEGLARTIEWTHNNITLIDDCVRKHSRYMAL